MAATPGAALAPPQDADARARAGPVAAHWTTALRHSLRGLSYDASADAASQRDLRLDLLRGFSVFAMVVDHLGGDSWLYAITGGNRFYVSAAEAFIFISGFVMGQAYHAKVQREGLVEAMLEALRRARTLYVTTVAMTLFFSALFLYTDVNLWTGRDFGLGIESVEEVVVGALTLHYTYHGTDILAMYALLVLAAPLSFLLLSTGRWQWVLFPSWLWWLAYQVFPEQAGLPWYIRNGENFPLAAWQVLFVTGLVMGFHRGVVTRWLQRFRRLRLFLLALGVAVTFALLSLYTSAGAGQELPLQVPFGLFDTGPDALSERFLKVPLRPWRIAAFIAVAIFAYTVATYAWQPLKRATGWLLLPFGQRALYSYIIHFFLILVAYNVAPRVFPAEIRQRAPELVDTSIQVIAVAILWLMVRYRVLFRIVPN